MTEPITSGSQNSPRHSNGNLCYSLGRRDGNSLGQFPVPHPQDQAPKLESVGQRTITVMAPILALDSNFQTFRPTDHLAAEYYPDHAAPRSMCTSRPHEQFTGYYPTANSAFVSAAQNPIMPSQPLDIHTDLGGFYGPPVTQQPPLPPAAPESSIPSTPSFYYHPCRWLGGPQCDGFAPGKNREMGEHLRVLHHFVGHERDTVECQWENCGQVMQRMNVPRHIVSRHLLAAANCRFCAKRFSRPDVVSRHERTCTNAAFPS